MSRSGALAIVGLGVTRPGDRPDMTFEPISADSHVNPPPSMWADYR
jgi:hypothetical protein